MSKIEPSVSEQVVESLDRLLTPEELAEYLTIPIATIYAWRYQGKGPPGFRVGRHLRYREGDVEDWLGRQLAESTRETP